jgi:hypothetical protein
VIKLLIIFVVLLIAIAIWIWRSRRRSIVDIKGRNQHFSSLGKQFNLTAAGDEFFLQLEGIWKNVPILIYPHSFEGPGSITVFYFNTGIPYQDRTWIEPSLSLGRAIVDWKKGIEYNFEISGSIFSSPELLTELNRLKKKYPFVGVTLPTRFILSHYMMQSLSGWKNFVAILVLDAGRKPSLTEIQNTLDDGTGLVQAVKEATSSISTSSKSEDNTTQK